MSAPPPPVPGAATPGAAAPRLRVGVHLAGPAVHGDARAVLEDPLSGAFFETDARSAAFLALLDGRTEPDLVRARMQAAGADAPSAEAVEHILAEAARHGLLDTGTADAPTRRPRRRLGAVVQRVPLGTMDRTFGLAQSLLGPLTGRVGALVWLGLVGTALAMLPGHAADFAARLHGLFSISAAPLLFAAWLLAKVWHELHHAVVARRYAVEVREAGLMFVLFAPIGAYVDVSGVWRLASRWQRLHITAAGAMGELALAAIAFLLWVRWPGAEAAPFLQALALTASVSAVLININPLMRFDGYHALVDLTDTPNLYQRGIAAVANRAARALLGAGTTPAGEPGWVELYGAAAIAWRVVLAVTLTMVAAHLAFGFGAVLGILVVWSLLVRPLLRFLAQLRRAEAPNRRRATRRAALAAGALGLVVAVPVPAAPRSPAVLAYADTVGVRLKTAGLVEAVLVAEGERVAAGTPLLRLSNPALQAEARRLAATVRRHRIEADASRAEGDLAGARTGIGRAAVAAREQDEVRRRIDNLTVTAPSAGIVATPRLAELTGRWLPRGELVLDIADPARREVEAFLSPRHAEALAAAPGEPHTFVAFAGAGRAALSLARVDPAARQTPPPDVLTAKGGGPLDLDVTGTEPRLAAPVMAARFDVTGPVDLPAGMPGWVETDRPWRPLGLHLLDRLPAPARWPDALTERLR